TAAKQAGEAADAENSFGLLQSEGGPVTGEYAQIAAAREVCRRYRGISPSPGSRIGGHRADQRGSQAARRTWHLLPSLTQGASSGDRLCRAWPGKFSPNSNQEYERRKPMSAEQIRDKGQTLRQ